MKKIFTLFAGACLFSLAIAGCSAPKATDPAVLQAKADSVYTVKSTALSDSAKNACEATWSSKVQTMSDSIVNAKTADQAAK